MHTKLLSIVSIFQLSWILMEWIIVICTIAMNWIDLKREDCCCDIMDSTTQHTDRFIMHFKIFLLIKYITIKRLKILNYISSHRFWHLNTYVDFKGGVWCGQNKLVGSDFYNIYKKSFIIACILFGGDSRYILSVF